MWVIHLSVHHVQHRHAYLRRSIPVFGPFEGQSDSLTIQLARKLPLICGPVCQGGRTKRRPDGFSGAASSGRLRVDVVACVSVRDDAVMLICAGWLPQDGAVRLERFCWSSGSFPVSVILARVALCCRGFRVGAVLPKWCSAGGCVAVDGE